MKLTDEEKKMLSGEYGEMVKKSMDILVTLGDIYGAKKMLKTNNVHSPGVSYRVTGDAGLNFVKEAAFKYNSCSKCSMTLNTIGIDYDKAEELGFSKEFTSKQRELLKAYEKIGALGTYSCTPYLIGNIPKFGEHVAWGESSAVAYVNSVMGARTNREGGPTALAAALTGRVPEYGYHLDENRLGDYLIKVETKLECDRDYGALGYYVGQIVGDKVPVFENIKDPTLENLKALSAALASSGAVALYHVKGVTPEAKINKNILKDDVEEIIFGEKEMGEVGRKFNKSGNVDMVLFGCPHASIEEIKKIAKLLKNKKIKSEIWVTTSKPVAELGERLGFNKTIRDSGAKIVTDTCPVLSETVRDYDLMLTNSAKMAHYAPGLWNLDTVLISMEKAIESAIDGYWGGDL
jgi:hypothetical protein